MKLYFRHLLLLALVFTLDVGFMQAIFSNESRDEVLLMDEAETALERVEAEFNDAVGEDWPSSLGDALHRTGNSPFEPLRFRGAILLDGQAVAPASIKLYDLFHCWKIHCA